MRKEILYKDVSINLRDRIISGEFTEGKLYSERQLAEEYNINRITLRKALNLLEDENIIYKKGQSGSYIRQKTSRTIVLKNRTIAFILVNRDHFDPYHSQVLSHLESIATLNRFNLIFKKIKGPEEAKSFIDQNKKDKSIHGAILGGIVTPSIAEEFLKADFFTFISAELSYPDKVEEEFDQLIVNSFEYGYRATDFLIKRKWKKIGLLNRLSFQLAMNIYYGYMKALDCSRLELNEEYVGKIENNSVEAVAELTLSLLSKNRLDALFVANERMMPGVLSALETLKIRPNKDLEIITVGGMHKEYGVSYHLLSVDIKLVCDHILKLMRNRFLHPDSCKEQEIINDFKIIPAY